MEASLR